MSDVFPCIICTYSKELDDYREAAQRAYKQHGLEPGQCTMLVVPAGSRSLELALKARPLNIDEELER